MNKVIQFIVNAAGTILALIIKIASWIGEMIIKHGTTITVIVILAVAILVIILAIRYNRPYSTYKKRNNKKQSTPDGQNTP